MSTFETFNDMGSKLIDGIFETGGRIEREYGPMPLNLILAVLTSVASTVIIKETQGNPEAALDASYKLCNDLLRSVDRLLRENNV